ncbi:apoptosis-associated speck-like protein containing a CARD isoform X1 [Siniperca chuatsi]|uniref:apoptosis-associated speck-like protein containing a CARD isoform X1 n=1 Tax=Siniperca chuatsi TaxID=119488 RepID=UPI001CE10B3B|nr:apoptosis-associated speck-like protein containing a CARD isoform X1 [Siniperca chuatsi]
MPPQTIRKALADMLEDLSQLDFEKFCRQLLDRREEQRVRRSRVESKSFLDIADVLVSTFGEPNALQVAVEVLRQIDCNLDADRLVEETSALLSKSGSSDTARPSAGATGVNIMADDIHFVDKHRTALINRVSNIAPILDELVDKNVIQQETYDRIRILPTTQEKMRELYSGCLKASGTCKDIFYKILEENEKYLIADLKNK